MQEEEDKEYQRARRKVRQLQHFYRHLIIYGVIITFLHIINLITSSYYWAIWPTLGWGVAVAIHASQHLDWLPMFDEEWEERKIQEIMAKRQARDDKQTGSA